MNDLRLLAQGDGALHAISGLIYRDWVLTVDRHEARVIDEPEQRWSAEKLNNNELMLLLGLAVQSSTDKTYKVLPPNSNFADQADVLLRELHDRIAGDAMRFDPVTGTLTDFEEVVGAVAREAIYYGADGFYIHQFKKIARYRYREDQEWMLGNVGISIRSIIDIAKFIFDRISLQMDYTGQAQKAGKILNIGDLTSSLLISKADLRAEFGEKADAFISKFSTGAICANTDFKDPFCINRVNIAPLIDLGEFLYVPSQYKLFQSVYESPFYWMMADVKYRDTASKHRGQFLEKIATHILELVFGNEHVHKNVTIIDGKKIVGEIDVLVIYGEFLIVGQAKSKRVSLKARAGDREAIAVDFKGAIQDPYDQAVKCAQLITQGGKCLTSDKSELAVPPLPRIFPMVVLSDHFPAATHLSGRLLQRVDEVAPVIWDIGFLDCVTRILSSPIELIFYLQSRSQNFDKVHSESELVFLGFHLRSKLALPTDVDWMMIERDFVSVVDDFMIAADLGITAERPLGVLEQLDIPVITELFGVLKNADPRLAGVVVDLYDFSSAALVDLSATILDMRDEIHATGKTLKAFSMPTSTGGLTYVVTKRRNAEVACAAQLLGAKHKYDNKSDRWYVIVDSVETDLPIDGLLPLIWPWIEDEDEAVRSVEVGAMFNSQKVPVTVGTAAARRHSALKQ